MELSLLGWKNPDRGSIAAAAVPCTGGVRAVVRNGFDTVLASQVPCLIRSRTPRRRSFSLTIPGNQGEAVENLTSTDPKCRSAMYLSGHFPGE